MNHPSIPETKSDVTSETHGLLALCRTVEFNPEFGPQKGDVVVHEHWAQSSFANTDLDLQLKQHSIRKIILVGMVANTCIESTGRFGMELGYHVTLVKDATAAFSREAMQAAIEVNWPTFAHAILTTPQLLAAIG
jgi:nicotinamidase-related amidase